MRSMLDFSRDYFKTMPHLIYERNVMPEIRDELLFLLQEVPDDLLPVVDILGQHLLCNTPLIIHRAVWRIRNVYPGSSSVADQEPGSGIRCLFDPWIRDPGPGIGFFRIPDPGSRISDPGSRIPDLGSRIPDP